MSQSSIQDLSSQPALNFNKSLEWKSILANLPRLEGATRLGLHEIVYQIKNMIFKGMIQLH